MYKHGSQADVLIAPDRNFGTHVGIRPLGAVPQYHRGRTCRNHAVFTVLPFCVF